MPAAALPNVIDGQDMRVIEGRGHLRFTLKANERGSRHQIGGKKLDRNRTVQFGVKSTIDHTHATFAELLFNTVLTDGLAGHNWPYAPRYYRSITLLIGCCVDLALLVKRRGRSEAHTSELL